MNESEKLFQCILFIFSLFTGHDQFLSQGTSYRCVFFVKNTTDYKKGLLNKCFSNFTGNTKSTINTE